MSLFKELARLLMLLSAYLTGPALAYSSADVQKLTDTNKCENCDLSGVTFGSRNFNGAQLAGASFKDAAIANTSFRNADLRNVDMRGAVFFRVDFTGADLTGSSQSGALFFLCSGR